MNKALPEAFHPYVGLTSVFATDAGSESRLPEDSRLQPIDAAVEAQLQAMLQAETFERLILEAVRPEVLDRNVLAPSRFHTLRDEIIQRLEARLRQTSDADEHSEVRAALDLLRLRAREHELGESLRYALIKG